MSDIAIQKLTKSWADLEVVQGIDCRIEKGTFAVVLGPSGCGKSTVLRMIAGLESVTSGEIRIDGKAVSQLPPAQRGLSMVFQSYALFPHLSVAENIVFGLSVRKVPAAERQKKMRRIAEQLSLAHLLERKPSQLSGGQQQRVALARALVAEKSVCLLDEPLSNLDAQLRQEMRTEIRSLQQRLGMTMIFVTHDQTEALSMADQVILMRRGRIEQDGSPAALYQRPASAFVAGFIGGPPMNLLDLDDGASGGVIAGARHGTVLCGTVGTGLQLGVRPEDIELSATGIAATVENTEFLGADSILSCRVGTQSLLVRVQGAAPRCASQVFLRWRPESAHCFDKSTGLRLERPTEDFAILA